MRTKCAWRSGRSTKVTKRDTKDVEIWIIFDEYSGKTRWSLIKGRYNPKYPKESAIVWKSKY